jgi:hypothetical protein
MRSLLLLPLVFSVGCLNEYGEYDLGGGGGDSSGGGGGGGYSPPAVSTTEATTGGCYRCPVAVGGSTLVTVAHGSATVIQVRQASPAFELVVDPAPAGFSEYVLTANAPGETKVIASSGNYPDTFALVAAFDVDSVQLVPVGGATHHPLGSELVWHTSMQQAVIALTSSEKKRLVDVSVELMFASSAAIELDAWDTLRLPTGAGQYTVLVRADSFGQRQFPFELVSEIDRVESSVEGTLERVGDIAEICFYPLLGARDVVMPVAIELGGLGDLVPTGIASGSNCRRVQAKAAGVQQVDGTALGRMTSLWFTIAP